MSDLSTPLSNQSCEPCRGGIQPLSAEEIAPLLLQLGTEWNVVDDHHIKKTFLFDNFVDALDFTNRIGALAEEIGHHPDIYLTWGKVTLTIWTHKIDGLAKADFIFAAKCETRL